MIAKPFLAFLVAATLAVPMSMGHAADASELAPGKYKAALTPTVGPNTSHQVMEELGRIRELSDVRVTDPDSIVYFTVKDNMRAKVSWLNEAIQRVAPGVSLGAWQLEPANSTLPDNRDPQPMEKSGLSGS